MNTESAGSKITPSPSNHDSAESVENQTPTHKEKHSGHSEIVSDIIIGFADGLTVPFALTAGLSSVGSLNLVILGGLAELFAGAISMGLGAFLAAVTEDKHYRVEEAREWREVNLYPQAEEKEIYDIMATYGLDRECVQPIVKGLMANKDMWVQVRLNFLIPSSEC
jgi:VIT1/CCC1 family predicted Fe2+/Mn2+ transporter